jgi:hypothetical protein
MAAIGIYRRLIPLVVPSYLCPVDVTDDEHEVS